MLSSIARMSWDHRSFEPVLRGDYNSSAISCQEEFSTSLGSSQDIQLQTLGRRQACLNDSKKIRGVDSVSVTYSSKGRILKDTASWQPLLPSLVLIAFDRYLLST